MIAWVRKGVCGLDSLDCYLKVHTCICVRGKRGRGSVGVGVIVWVGVGVNYVGKGVCGP